MRNPLVGRAAALALAGALGGWAPVSAQTPVPTFEESVVVSVSAEQTERERTSATVTVIDGDEIAARQATTVDQLLGTVAGTTVATAGPPGQQTSVFIRGTESDQTLLLWNGVELNNPYFGSINWAFLPTDGAERVEVVRGPYSWLYGGNAIGGVVQLFTGSLNGARLSLEGGSDDYYRGAVVAGGDLGALRFDVTGSLRRGDSELDNGFFDSEDLIARLSWQAGERVELGLVARANDSETGIPLVGGQPDLNRRIAWQEREIALPVTVRLGEVKLSGQLSQVELESAYRDPDDPFGFTASDTDSRGRRARLVASWAQGDWRAALGGEWERLEVTDSSSFGLNLDAARQRTWAAFGEVGVDLGRLSLDAGVRHDDNDVYGGETSLRGGAVFELTAATRLRASYGEAFRPPSLGELFFPGSGNPGLAPESAESIEIGVVHERGGWRFELIGFETRQENLIDFDFVTFTNVNVGRARSRGVEATAGWRGERFDGRLALTYLEAEDLESGLALLRRPEESASLILTWRPQERWSLTLTTRHVGERPDVDTATFPARRLINPSYTRFDLAARWQLSERWAPYARVENLLDQEYAEVFGFPAPGSTLVGGIAVGF